ncbi:MAG: hypothetical protein NUV46_02505 [Nanoarchaeota archaeon]|nr:hypothetical protein [Nanoarchaeota archaeon]
MKNEKIEEKVEKNDFKGKTYIDVYVCDQGHYGISYCGNCRETLDDEKDKNYCPKCNYEFMSVKADYNQGGSDF